MMTRTEAAKLVHLWCGPRDQNSLIPPQTPASLRRWGATGSAKALEEAIAIMATCPECGSDDVEEIQGRLHNCCDCGCTWDSDGEIVSTGFDPAA